MSHSRLYLVKFHPQNKSVVASPDSNLLDAAQRAGIGLMTICGGQGECGDCRVIVLEGDVSPLTADERDSLKAEELRAGVRLACCTRVKSSIQVQIIEKKPAE